MCDNYTFVIAMLFTKYQKVTKQSSNNLQAQAPTPPVDSIAYSWECCWTLMWWKINSLQTDYSQVLWIQLLGLNWIAWVEFNSTPKLVRKCILVNQKMTNCLDVAWNLRMSMDARIERAHVCRCHGENHYRCIVSIRERAITLVHRECAYVPTWANGQRLMRFTILQKAAQIAYFFFTSFSGHERNWVC